LALGADHAGLVFALGVARLTCDIADQPGTAFGVRVAVFSDAQTRCGASSASGASAAATAQAA